MESEIESEDVLRKRFQVRGITVLIIQVGICATIFWFLFGATLLHNWNLMQLDKSFGRVVHPQQTAHLSSVNEVGLLIGNGDHCDFFVGHLRSFTGSRKNIQNFYSKSKIWNPLNNSLQPIDILFLENGEIPSSQRDYLPREFDSASRWLSTPLDRKQNYYLVYFFDVGYDAGFDVRCL